MYKVLSFCNQMSNSFFDMWFAVMVPPQSENASYASAWLRILIFETIVMPKYIKHAI